MGGVRILQIDPVEQTARVQPGVVNADLSRAAATHGLRYTPDPSSWQACTIGGNIATGAGGLCCVKYGTAAQHVRALTAVLADGRILRTGSPAAKSVAGLDLTRLLVGSEGTLAVIIEAEVALRPRTAEPLVLAAEFPDVASACRAVVEIMSGAAGPRQPS